MRRLRVTLVAFIASAIAFSLQFTPELAAQQRGALPPAAQNQAQPIKGTGLISGKVVDAATDQPIDGATLTVVGRSQVSPTPGPQRGGGAPAQTRLITGADGRFVMHDLPAGNFGLNATAPGYTGGSYGQPQPSSSGQPLTLADGERVTDAKIRLWKTAVLTGTVLDDAGEPAVGIDVRAYRRVATGGRVRFAQEGNAMTDDRGVYRISSLTPGQFIVAVPQIQSTMPMVLLDSMLQSLTAASPVGAGMIAELMSSGPTMRGSSGVRVGDSMLASDNGAAVLAGDGRVLAYQTIFFPSASTASQATTITLRSGEERSDADVQLRVVPTARVSGIVTTPTGPAGMTSVRLIPVTASDSNGLDLDVGNTTTRADGTFTFLGIPPGQYLARVFKPARQPIPPELASNPMVQMALGGSGGASVALYGDAPITVSGTDVSDLTVVLLPGVKLSGRFEFVGASAPPTPQQLRAATITAQSSDARRIGGPPNQTPNDQGEFTLSGFPAGTYVMAASVPGATWIVKSILADGRNVTREPLEVKDADIGGIVVTFTDRIGQMSGTVHGPTGAALAPGATVFLVPSDYRDWIGTSDGRAIRTAPIVKGAYTIGGLLAGDYLMAAIDGLDMPDARDVAFFDAIARVATHVTLADGEKKTIDLTPVKVVR
jgi:hypothetical protein